MIPFNQIYIFTVLFVISAITPDLGAQQQIIDLQKIGEILHYPSEHLVLENCLDSERLIYSVKTLTEQHFNKEIKFISGNIQEAYKISSDIPSSFHPIKITIVKRGTYRNKKFTEFEQWARKMPEIPIAQGGRLPLGDFRIADKFNGFIMPDTIRISAHRTLFKSNSTHEGEYRENDSVEIDATSAFIKLPGNDFDLRVSRYVKFEGNGQELVKVEGGEKYYDNFNTNLSDHSPENMTRELFGDISTNMVKSLSTIILESPALAKYCNNQVLVSLPQKVPEASLAKISEKTDFKIDNYNQDHDISPLKTTPIINTYILGIITLITIILLFIIYKYWKFRQP